MSTNKINMNLSKKLLSVCGKNVFLVCCLKQQMRAIGTMLKLNNDKSTKTFIYDSTDYVRCAVLSPFRKPTSSIHWHFQTDDWGLQINNVPDHLLRNRWSRKACSLSPGAEQTLECPCWNFLSLAFLQTEWLVHIFQTEGLTVETKGAWNIIIIM